ncbi:hypothetical protein ACF0H5_023630 [Mactra antiquata]
MQTDRDPKRHERQETGMQTNRDAKRHESQQTLTPTDRDARRQENQLTERQGCKWSGKPTDVKVNIQKSHQPGNPTDI